MRSAYWRSDAHPSRGNPLRPRVSVFTSSDAVAHEQHGSYSYSTSTCTSGSEVDPVSLTFHHGGTISTVVSHFASDAAWGTGGSTGGQYFYSTHSPACLLPEQSVKYDLSDTRRYHARLKAGSDVGSWGDWTYGTPHYEKVDFLCNPPWPDHVTTSFTQARNAALPGFRNAHATNDNAQHRHHFVWLANTKAIQQCDGSWVSSDGWLALVDLSFDNSSSVSGFWRDGVVYSRHYSQDDMGKIWERYQNVGSGAWSSWRYLDSPPNGCSSAPGSLGDSLLFLGIFCREQSQSNPQAPYNSRIWRRRFDTNTGQWLPWQALQSSIGFEGTSYGAAVNDTSGPREYEFSVGRDGNLWRRYYDVNTQVWYNWESVGSPSGGCTSRPGAASINATNVYTVCKAMTGEIRYSRWNGSAWGSWQSLGYPPSGGNWKGGPAVAAVGARLYVLASDGIGNAWSRYLTLGGSWTAWSNIFGSCAGSVYAALLPAYNWMDVSCRWTDQNIYYRRWDGSSWGPGWYLVGKP